MRSLISYLKNVRAEMKHVVWPPLRVAAIHTALILLISVIVAAYVGGLDYVFTGVVDRLING